MVLGMLRYSFTEGYQPIWITYLGTSESDGIGNLVIDASGVIFLGGTTISNYRDTYPCFINDNNPYQSGMLMQLRSELPTLIPTDPPSIPHIVLSAPWPQPSSGHSTVRFDLPESDVVSISLHDAGGRRIQNVLEGVWLNAGTHTKIIRWKHLSPGVYFIQLAGFWSKAVTKLLIQ
jgi:hypothetical protein